MNNVLEKGEVLYGQVLVVIDRLYVKHRESPLPEYLDVHLLVCAFETMFPRLLTACHGFLVDVVPVMEGSIFEEGWKPHRLTSLTPGSVQLPVMMKQIPHSWLLHKESNTIIDVLPLGCKPGFIYPVCRPPHPNRPKYISDTVHFKRLGGNLPNIKKAKELRELFEEWSKDMAPVFISA